MLIHRLRLGATIAAAVVASVLVALPAWASKPADLRVVAESGRTLAQFRQYTGSVHIKADPNADCFGPPGGSGNSVAIDGATGLGLVKDAMRWDPRLRPLSITDQFSFGLAVCGIGGDVAQGNSFWYLKDDHAGSQVGGDQLHLHAGDDVLWSLAPSYPPPAELALSAPPAARPGVPFEVSVHGFADDGTKSPVAGASISGGTAPPTGGDGTTMVTVADTGFATLQASHTSDESIPSNRVEVCVQPDLSRCPDAHGKLIFGSDHADEITGTPGWDTIQAGPGDDVIKLLNGDHDRVACGGGHDRVVEHAGDRDRIADGCEKVIKR